MVTVKELIKKVDNNPFSAKAHNDLGTYYFKRKKYDKAVDYYIKAIELKPEHAQAYNALGLSYFYLRKADDAIESFKSAIELNPKFAEAYINLSEAYFLKGDISTGLEFYSIGYKLNGPKFRKPECNGENMANKTIYVHCDEKDIGKAIMLSRFLSDFKKMDVGIDVLFQPPKNLEKLLVSAKLDFNLPPKPSKKKKKKGFKFDEHIALSSIPKLLNIDFDDAYSLRFSKYLDINRANIDGIKEYKKKVFNNDKFKIGIFWRGSSDGMKRGHSELENFLSFSKNPNVMLYSFQKSNILAQRRLIKQNSDVVDLSKKVNDDYLEIASCVSELNLVITIDSNFAQMAAGLGIPTWLVLDSSSEGIWSTGREGSHLYSNILLFRRELNKNRDDVFVQMNEHLSALFRKQKFNTPSQNINAGLIYVKTRGKISADYYKEALNLFEKKINLDSTDIEFDPRVLIYNQLGSIFASKRSYHKALDYFNKAKFINPNDFDSNFKYACILSYLGKSNEAISSFEDCLNLKIDEGVLFALACEYLSQRDFKNGFKYYECRKYSQDFSCLHYPRKKYNWNGEDLSGKVIWVYPEQGNGDSIQFSRYLFPLSKMAKKVIFNPYPNMQKLFKESNVPFEIWERDELPEKKRYDYRCSIMSLPYMLNATVENIPCTSKYLCANEGKVQKYREKYFDNDFFKIGIKWKGNPEGMSQRIAKLKDFYGLSKISGVKLYSLQVGDGIEELKELPEDIEIINPCQRVRNFSDTAAIIENLDLVISIDTGLAHLAAAMGKPTWILLPFVSEWRWFSDSYKTPWYESVKLFKQKKNEFSWSGVFDKISKELNNIL